MKKENNVIILKLGGSILTDKNTPFSLRKEVIENIVVQIRKTVVKSRKIVIVHGGGSYGHPLAKKYQISAGKNQKIKDQMLGLTKTHHAMTELNYFLVQKLIESNLPALSIQTSSIFMLKNNKIIPNKKNIAKECLDQNLLPVLYGDIILDSAGSFSIMSGDQIIFELCKSLTKSLVSKVIFCMEKDGIYVEKRTKEKVQPILARKLDCKELYDIKLADLAKKIDVTGGIVGKIKWIQKICRLGVLIQIVNGLKENNIFKALNSQDVVSTIIQPLKTDESLISNRKIEHLKIPINKDIQHSVNYFDDIKLIHHAYPENNYDEVDISTEFFGKKIKAPICISAITGGHKLSKEINRILAKAAQKEGIIMSVGSQRAGILEEALTDTFGIVREVAPNIPIIGNIGIGQISESNFKKTSFQRLIDMIQADAIAVHFNPLHEMLQVNGDRSYKTFKENFLKIRNEFNLPIIAKEVGSGLNREVALKLNKMGFDGFDVGGAGGTSFAAIEYYRAPKLLVNYTRHPAKLFWEWGIPTPASIYEIRDTNPKLIIATGGLRNGMDIAKAIALGADIGGFAYKFLRTAWDDYKQKSTSTTIKEIRTLKQELKSCLWLMNLKNCLQLKKNRSKYIIFKKLYKWIKQRQIDYE
ncbi:MAG: type 2 isopentenyl-diphosphate Delta-isomerase [Candidatus Lokiarchaeota archaeon]|nr:type 2 isopentenyl-diphosphate Delta-isomerase [Candidatus Lokiarchaeota archaeon]MBD3337841.1 type 2 isopentenyl-diphosphate Delta-isomerase [Candidatus Lokiarchaeota archaeon]